MKLEPDSVGGAEAARKPGPFDRALALLDPLLAGPALVVEGDDILSGSSHIGDDVADARIKFRPDAIRPWRRHGGIKAAKLEAKSAIVDVRAAAKENTGDAIKTLKTVMNNDHAPSAARVGAAIAILDRGWGKPTQAVEASVSILDQMTDDEQKAMLAAVGALRDA